MRTKQRINAALRITALSAAIAAAGIGSGWAANPVTDVRAPATAAAESGRAVYIVGLKQAPLASYEGNVRSLARPARLPGGRLDVKSAEAVAYVQYLVSEQDAFMSRIGQSFGRAIAPTRPDFRFQHAFNGMVLELTPEEAITLLADPDVALVEGYREYSQTTDTGPNFIGANTIWNGTNVPGGIGTRGEGMVAGVIDSGVNMGSPSFADVDIDGYDHTNPLGGGVYLGWCNPANPNHVAGRDVCNDKLIGGWDFVDTLAIPGTHAEALSFEDGNGHGSHTTATVAGNRRSATIFGASTFMQGVAPRANIIAYDACYTVISTGTGTCPNTALTASVNQAVADGIVDTLNYSISGGTSPWTDPTSAAFLGAQNAGIFIAVSAGNGTVPVLPGSTNHVEPWTTGVGASTHSRGFFGNVLNITSAAPPAAGLNVGLKPGVAPPYISASLANTTPLIRSPNFDSGSNNDGCVAYPADTFRRGGVSGIALVHWTAGASACGTIARANAAGTGGAAGVILMSDIPLNAAAGGSVPAWVLENNPAGFAALNTYAQANAATATAEVLFPGSSFPGTPDVMADFSLLGPSTFELLKPDVTAPGVNVLSAILRWTQAGGVNPANNGAVGLNSGTSMSSPHVAGAATLLRAVNPSWTPTEVKSVLVSTGVTAGVFKPDGTTLADPFNRGGGRIDLTKAARAALVMNETGANFLAANPTTGGVPRNLNLPSFQVGNCVVTCAQTRTVRNSRNQSINWVATVVGLPGSSTASPASFTTAAGATQVITLNLDGAAISQTAYQFGELVLTPNDPLLPTQRFPIAARAGAPDINVTNTAGLTASVAPGGTTTVQFQVQNSGNPTINWSLGTGTQNATLFGQSAFLNNGFISARFAGVAVPNTGTYVADDMYLGAASTVTTLRADGFVLPSGLNLSSAAVATQLTFNVYADAGGVPAGAPEGVGSAPLWTFSAAQNAAGITTTNNNIQLNLATAGAPALSLPAGRYWVNVFPSMPGNGTGSSTGNPLWAWRITAVGAPTSGLAPAIITPASSATWAVPTLTNPPGPGPAAGFTTIVNGSTLCGSAWATADVASGSLGALGSTTVTLTLNATSLTSGTYRANICVLGNDTDEPNTLVPVTLQVLGDDIFSNGFEN